MEIDFKNRLKSLNIELSDKQLKQFEIYYEVLTKWNKKINLTTITEKDGVYLKHFFDSLNLVKAVSLDNQKLLDVGSGAGFPSIPLKIVYPNLDITILDALRKRINFLKILTEKLNINVNLAHGRAEEFKMKNCFDIVTARAVANLPILTELCLPHVSVDGYFLALKGPNYEEELSESMNAINILSGKYDKTIMYDVDGIKHSILMIKKVNKTRKGYPRKFKKIKSNPL